MSADLISTMVGTTRGHNLFLSEDKKVVSYPAFFASGKLLFP